MITNFSYRKHLDGLRAISVIAILLFHINPRILPGGYLGVDVFFIISGYLITSLLTVEYMSTGKIDFKNFYLRRFRRLFPSFLLVLVLTLVGSILRLFPSQLVDLSKSLISSLFGISNLYFNNTTSYFGNSASEKPLLHIWSLSVEEQFYLVWPIAILILISRYSKKWLTPCAIASLCFVFSYFENTRIPTSVFYLPYFRLYEFIFGASLAWYLLDERKSHIASKWLAVLSFLTLGAIFLFVDSSHTVPGKISIPLILATAGLIAFGDALANWNILTWKVSQYLGRRSYTIYLVHWPLIVIASINTYSPQNTLIKDISLFILSIALGSFIFKYFEEPIRRKAIRVKYLYVSSIVAWCLLMLLSVLIVKFEGVVLFQNKNPIFTQSQIENGKQHRFIARIEMCQKKGWDSCDSLSPVAKNALVVGDSHAPDALTILHYFAPKDNFAVSTLGGCPPSNRMKSLVPAAHPSLDQCISLNRQRYDVKYLRNFDYIAIDVLFDWYSPSDLMKYLDFLQSNRIKKVIVFGQYLTLSTDLPDLINKYGYDCNEVSKYIEKDGNLNGYRVLARFMKDKGYLFVPAKISKSNPLPCSLWNRKGVPFSWDDQHVSYEFVFALFEDSRLTVQHYLDK